MSKEFRPTRFCSRRCSCGFVVTAMGVKSANNAWAEHMRAAKEGEHELIAAQDGGE